MPVSFCFVESLGAARQGSEGGKCIARQGSKCSARLTWAVLGWIGLSNAGLDPAGLTCAGLSWTGLGWIHLGRARLVLTGPSKAWLDQAGLIWLEWAGLTWVGLGWA